MSRDALLSEALYEADKLLEKFAVALHSMSINDLHLCLRLLCRLLRCNLLHRRKPWPYPGIDPAIQS